MRSMVLAAALAAAVASVSQAASAPLTTPQRGREASFSPRMLLGQINRVRTAHGLRPLRLSPQLDASATQHSEEMGERGYFEHASFDGTAFWKRISRHYAPTGYRFWSVGENLLWSSGSLTPGETVDMWMNSPPHRRNLLDHRWRKIGLSAREFRAAPGAFQRLDVTIVTADFGVRY